MDKDKYKLAHLFEMDGRIRKDYEMQAYYQYNKIEYDNLIKNGGHQAH